MKQGRDAERFSVKSAIVPVYHKLRICLADVLEKLSPFHAVILHCLEDFKLADEMNIHRLVWDVYLSAANDFKKWVRNPSNGITASEIDMVLLANLPRYLWVVSALEQGDRLMTFLIDATGIAQDMRVVMVIGGAQRFVTMLSDVSRKVVAHFETNRCELTGIARDLTFEDESLFRMARNPFVRRMTEI